MDMAGTMLGGKGQKTRRTIPSSNNNFSRCISDMAGDVLKRFLQLQASELYALQQMWQAWHSSWYMSVMFMGDQLSKTSSSTDHWKPEQHERICFKYWTAL
jgi:hypothetical protein